jgi:hypothetical protein
VVAITAILLDAKSGVMLALNPVVTKEEDVVVTVIEVLADTTCTT